jgi:hypothetical protein
VVLDQELSPKLQFHISPPVTREESVNVTMSGAVPVVGTPEKDAVGWPGAVTWIYPACIAVLLPETLVTVSETV